MLRLILILRSREPAATTSASSWKLLAWKDCGRRLNGAMPSLTGAAMDNLGRLLLEKFESISDAPALNDTYPRQKLACRYPSLHLPEMFPPQRGRHMRPQ